MNSISFFCPLPRGEGEVLLPLGEGGEKKAISGA